MKAQVAALVLGDERAVDAEPLRELSLAGAAALAKGPQALAEAGLIGLGRYRRRRGLNSAAASDGHALRTKGKMFDSVSLAIAAIFCAHQSSAARFSPS